MLTAEHLSEVVHLAIQFRDYMKKMNKGYDQAMLAGTYRIRQAEAEMPPGAATALLRPGLTIPPLTEHRTYGPIGTEESQAAETEAR